jgi:hypothetical protein
MADRDRSIDTRFRDGFACNSSVSPFHKQLDIWVMPHPRALPKQLLSQRKPEARVFLTPLKGAEQRAPPLRLLRRW